MLPTAESLQFLREVDRRAQVAFEVSDGPRRKIVGVDAARRVVVGMRVRQVSSQNALEPERLHVAKPDLLPEKANLRVHPEVEEMRDPLLLRECVECRAAVRHQVVFVDFKSGMHRIPAVVPLAARPTSTAGSVGRWRAREADRFRERQRCDGESFFALRHADVRVDHVGRTQVHLRAEVPQGVKRQIEARDEGSNPCRGCLAPVPVPDVDHHHSRFPSVDPGWRHANLAALRIARLQAKFDLLRAECAIDSEAS